MKIQQSTVDDLVNIQEIKSTTSFIADNANIVISFGERETLEKCDIYPLLKAKYPNAEINIWN